MNRPTFLSSPIQNPTFPIPLKLTTPNLLDHPLSSSPELPHHHLPYPLLQSHHLRSRATLQKLPKMSMIKNSITRSNTKPKLEQMNYPTSLLPVSSKHSDSTTRPRFNPSRSRATSLRVTAMRVSTRLEISLWIDKGWIISRVEEKQTILVRLSIIL